MLIPRCFAKHLGRAPDAAGLITIHGIRIRARQRPVGDGHAIVVSLLPESAHKRIAPLVPLLKATEIKRNSSRHWGNKKVTRVPVHSRRPP